jgi:hypothetical protein
MIDMLIGMTIGAVFIFVVSFLYNLISVWTKDKK